VISLSGAEGAFHAPFFSPTHPNGANLPQFPPAFANPQPNDVFIHAARVHSLEMDASTPAGATANMYLKALIRSGGMANYGAKANGRSARYRADRPVHPS
jgi:hypothetical protein